MRNNVEHYVSIFLGYLWLITLVIGSLTLFGWVVKMFLRIIGVI